MFWRFFTSVFSPVLSLPHQGYPYRAIIFGKVIRTSSRAQGCDLGEQARSPYTTVLLQRSAKKEVGVFLPCMMMDSCWIAGSCEEVLVTFCPDRAIKRKCKLNHVSFRDIISFILILWRLCSRSRQIPRFLVPPHCACAADYQGKGTKCHECCIVDFWGFHSGSPVCFSCRCLYFPYEHHVSYVLHFVINAFWIPG